MSPPVEAAQRIHTVQVTETAASAAPGGHASPGTQCQPGHCRGAPDCSDRLCPGHPDDDTVVPLDPALRARFWMTYLGVLMMVVGGLVLWWIR